MLENTVCEALMKRYGLDSVRGGKWNMSFEGPDQRWWVPKHLQGTPGFTATWLTLSARMFEQSVANDRVLSAIPSLFQAISCFRARTSLVHALSERRRSSQESTS